MFLGEVFSVGCRPWFDKVSGYQLSRERQAAEPQDPSQSPGLFCPFLDFVTFSPYVLTANL
jgi:hypothetical protein